jgi:hypothetical protein
LFVDRIGAFGEGVDSCKQSDGRIHHQVYEVDLAFSAGRVRRLAHAPKEPPERACKARLPAPQQVQICREGAKYAALLSERAAYRGGDTGAASKARYVEWQRCVESAPGRKAATLLRARHS